MEESQLTRRHILVAACIISALLGCQNEAPPSGFKRISTLRDHWSYSSYTQEVAKAVYNGASPMTAIDHITLKLYLQQRDQMLRDNGVDPSDVGSEQLSSSSQTIERQGTKFGVASVLYPFLQITTVSKEDARGYDTVTCARYNNIPEISLTDGFCADVIRERLGVSLAQ